MTTQEHENLRKMEKREHVLLALLIVASSFFVVEVALLYIRYMPMLLFGVGAWAFCVATMSHGYFKMRRLRRKFAKMLTLLDEVRGAEPNSILQQHKMEQLDAMIEDK